MHTTAHVSRSQQSGSRFVPSKAAAWAVSKPSTNKISPYTKKEISQLLKASRTRTLFGEQGEHIPKFGIARSTDEEGKAAAEGFNLRRKSSRILGTLKARLEKNSRVFNQKLKELEPTVRSLTWAQASARSRNSRIGSNSTRLRNTIGFEDDVPKMFEKDQLGIGLLPASNLEGEKLVTVGGYIISLQEVNENITTVIKPRVSSDKSGLEVEIKIEGCSPTDIKFEKRYDTLIVIGVSKATIRRFEDFKTPKVKDGRSKLLDEKENPATSRFKILSLNDLNQVNHGYSLGSENEYFEEMHEIINIFVPKSVTLNQIFISKPDSKGRIFVKGP